MPVRKQPVAIEGVVALVLALLAVGLAILGVYSPWGALRFPVSMKLTGTDAILAYGGTCVLPILLGAAASMLGEYTFRTLEQSPKKRAGAGPAFFALMIGFFAATIGGCTTFATLIWPVI
jgi:hypothetical protein